MAKTLTMAFVPVARASEIPPGTVKIVEAGGQKIALCNVDGTFHAIEDRCSHDNGPLGEGGLAGNLLECPRHGAKFDVTNGRPVTLPAVIPVKRFTVKVEGGQVLVEV